MKMFRKLLTCVLLIKTVYCNSDIYWNDMVLDNVVKEAINPPMTTRILAILHSSMYESYMFEQSNESVNGAGFTVLTYFFPNNTYQFYEDTKLFNIGVSVANKILLEREVDNEFLKSKLYSNSSDVGKWNELSPLLPHFGEIKPMLMENVSDYIMPSPPSFDSDELKRDYNETFWLGSKNSILRTLDEKEIAEFWEAGKGTVTPPGMWNVIAKKLSLEKNMDLLKRLELLCVLNIALFDAGISAWNNKYIYNAWRPIVAFRESRLEYKKYDLPFEENWEPLLKTPPFPEYGSGHSTFSGAASEVLTYFFGDDLKFDVSVGNVTRSFSSLYGAAYEAGRSRIYGGIHFSFSDGPFMEMGKRVASKVIFMFYRNSPYKLVSSSFKFSPVPLAFLLTLMF